MSAKPSRILVFSCRPLLRREAVLSSASRERSHRFPTSSPTRRRADIGRAVTLQRWSTTLGPSSRESQELDTLPISLRLVNELHARLLAGVRGQESRPGEFRKHQVWIGSPGSTIAEARFIPPPSENLPALFHDWERVRQRVQRHATTGPVRAHALSDRGHPSIFGRQRSDRPPPDHAISLRKRAAPNSSSFTSARTLSATGEVLRRVVQRQRHGGLGAMARVLSKRRPSGGRRCLGKDKADTKPPGRVEGSADWP